MAVPGRKSDKLWRDALHIAAKRTDSEGKVLLAKMAERCVELAASGDIAAMKEIGDRLDGKPHQSVTTTSIKDVRHLSDSELIAILAGREGSGEGAAEPQGDPVVTH